MAVMLVKAFFVIVPFHKSAVLALLERQKPGQSFSDLLAEVGLLAENTVNGLKIEEKIRHDFHCHICSLAYGGHFTADKVFVFGGGGGTENEIAVAVVNEHIKAEACVFLHYRQRSVPEKISVESVFVVFIKVTGEPCACQRPERPDGIAL